ncbi:MBL fold metallo-hydrolase [Leucobacter sp. cx-328]|uniref:MBL fold metallo-hydrolase n=1 Tax=unclassified Leucobacter TaxID=2621730 RepID=UPI00165D9FC3|nr:MULTISPECIES: MBL fold metallo-hydrolase [unclassified Leucobacter]MBC9945131.1 MBL fold metallo-hydrolase [Leucobacter sp. cx-328]
MSEARIEQVITRGRIGAGLPGRPAEGLELENNVWLLGDDAEVLIIDAGHDAQAIADAVADRNVLGILLTHGHEDHVNAALELAAIVDTHIYLHPDDLFIWADTHGDALPDFELADGALFAAAGLELLTLHTPGHTPGSVSFAVPALNIVFSGDTLFHGGPGAVRWDYSSWTQILDSIDERLLSLPSDTAVLPGHGALTTVADEAPSMPAWRLHSA